MKNTLSLTIRLERMDDIPAFAAFLKCEPCHDNNHVIVMNVQACMSPEMSDGEGGSIPFSREERCRLIITSLMHEFGHVLEAHFKLPVNEEAIEQACQDWENAFDAPIQPPSDDSGVARKSTRERLDYSKGLFSLYDDGDPHGKLFIVAPGGQMIDVGSHADPAIDAARALWMCRVLNTAIDEPSDQQGGNKPIADEEGR